MPPVSVLAARPASRVVWASRMTGPTSRLAAREASRQVTGRPGPSSQRTQIKQDRGFGLDAKTGGEATAADELAYTARTGAATNMA